ncbi:MAG: DUF4091 domain-containing protein [Lentisphaeria bacterium]|nr:DUF4091 domain-containing protein [Lentisphaeria bacterium]
MKRFFVYMAVGVLALNCAAQVVLTETKNVKTGAKMLVLKNPLLSVKLNCSRGGMLESFIPANSGHEEVYISADNKGGMCEHIIAGSDQNRELSFSPYHTEIIKNTPEEAVICFSYRMKSGKLKDIEFQKIYTFPADAAVLAVEWKIINHSAENKGVSPWIRNIVTGYDQDNITAGKAGLDSDSSIMLQCGAFRKTASAADAFFEPARNWFSRIPKVPAEGKNVVNFIFDYNEVFQFYTVHFKHMHTMELLFRYIDLAPGGCWSGRFVITSGGSLPDVRFASRDIAANLIRENGSLKLSLTSPRNIKDTEVKLLDGKGSNVYSGKVSIEALKVVDLSIPDAAGDIFELQVYSGGKDLMIDRSYTGKHAKMDSTLAYFHAPRRPEKFENKLTPWEKDIAPFQTPAPRKFNVKLLKNSAANLQLWAGNSIERIMEKDYPASPEAFEDVSYSLCAAKGERESFQLAFRNIGKKAAGDFSLALKHSSLPGLKMQWNVLEYITSDRPSLGKKEIGRWPEVLEPDSSFKVNPGITRNVWVEFRVPHAAAAGTYDIQIEILQNGKVIALQPVKLRIFDFELPKIPNLRTDVGRFYGNYFKMAQRYGFKGKQKDLLEALNMSILDHRMSPRGLVASRSNLKAYEADLVRHIKAGANVFAFPGTANSDLKTRKAIEAIHEKHGVTHLSYVYAFDEIHSEQIPKVREWCEKWHKNHKIPILVVYYGGPVEPLYGAIDIWVRSHQPEDEKLIADRHGINEIWHTNSSLYSLETPWVQGRADMWKAFSAGMNGWLLWSVASWTNSPYIQVFRSGCNLHGVMYYPAPEGVRPGVRLKVLADAVDDFDYLCILRKECKNAKSSGKSPELVEEAEKLLNDKFFLDPALSGSTYLKKRNQVGELIEKFMRRK